MLNENGVYFDQFWFTELVKVWNREFKSIGYFSSNYTEILKFIAYWFQNPERTTVHKYLIRPRATSVISQNNEQVFKWN